MEYCWEEGGIKFEDVDIMGEPIINHPREAIRGFFDNGLDYRVMGQFILKK